MTDSHQFFDLDVLEDGRYLGQLIRVRFGCPMTQLTKIGQGFYAAVYGISMGRDPRRVIVKCHKYRGYSAREQAQLELLARHATVKIPEVYHLHKYTASLPFEALVMEYIPGINASRVQFPDPNTKARFVDTVIDNLLAWHSVRHPEGFGEIDGPFYESWLEFYGDRVGAYHKAIHAERHKETVSAYVVSVIDRSYETMSQIFADANREASLVHSDYNLWNVMVDPDTFQVTGVIDPIDAGWGDSEIDLFHLPNCRPDVGLLERYLSRVEVNETFAARYAFYRFWDDVKHYMRMGWYEEERFRRYAQALETEMDEL